MFVEFICGHVVPFPLLMADRKLCMIGDLAAPCMNLVSFSIVVLRMMQLIWYLVGVWK